MSLECKQWPKDTIIRQSEKRSAFTGSSEGRLDVCCRIKEWRLKFSGFEQRRGFALIYYVGFDWRSGGCFPRRRSRNVRRFQPNAERVGLSTTPPIQRAGAVSGAKPCGPPGKT